MIFASDNWAGASDKVIAALSAAARRGGPAYGNDDLTRRVGERFSELFEREVAVFLVGTGTTANTLGIANYARPGGIVFCHPFGEEKLWTHRVFVTFARRLAAAGHAVLRFDHRANGEQMGPRHEASQRYLD